ncbi:MAG: PilZ domain-containing protein [Acidobacteriota bacterium]
MKAARTGPNAFTIEFDSEDELREEHRTNLSQGGLRLPLAERPALFSPAELTLRGPSGAEVRVKGTVVAPLPDGVALAFEGDADVLLAKLLAAPAPEKAEKDVNDWDRLRGMSRSEKLIYAARAERTERQVLVQDPDPQVLYSLLKNPRLTIDEVVRVAKSSYLTFQTAELILKTAQWAANVEVKTALVHNPKTPPTFALRILPTLPEAEVKAIARGAATSMALKQAALKRLQGGG